MTRATTPWRIESERMGRWPWHVHWVVTDGQRRFTCHKEADAEWLSLALFQRQAFIDQQLIPNPGDNPND